MAHHSCSSDSLHQSWLHAWRRGDTPWDLGAPHQATAFLLKQYQILTAAQLRGLDVVLPGAGRAHDSSVFLQAGMKVCGLDLAQEAALWARRRFKNHDLFSYLVGDALKLLPPLEAHVVFDRAMLCALEPQQRRSYLQACQRALVANGVMLCIVFHEIDDSWKEMKAGPPYALTVEEVEDLFHDFFEILWMNPSQFDSGFEAIRSEYLVVAKRL